MGHLAYHLRDDFGRSCRTMSNLEYLLTWLLANMKARNHQHATSAAATAFSFVLVDDVDIKGFKWNTKFMYPPTNAAAA